MGLFLIIWIISICIISDGESFNSFTIVDDGTGEITATIWRKHVTPHLQTQQQRSNESIALGQRLLNLAIRSTPVVHSVDKVTSSLAIGDSAHLRGRLQLFRGAVTISATYCRRFSPHIRTF